MTANNNKNICASNSSILSTPLPEAVSTSDAEIEFYEDKDTVLREQFFFHPGPARYLVPVGCEQFVAISEAQMKRFLKTGKFRTSSKKRREIVAQKENKQ